MFCKASLLTVAVALVASATPIVQEQGIRIDLPKRASLTKANGVFDHDRFLVSHAKTINKHRQNLINLEKNRGLAAFNKGAKILERRDVPEHLLEKRQSEALTDQQEEEWTGSVTIGSNKQSFIIDFDTGSSDLWVPNANKCSTCRGKHTYNSKTSTTSKSKSGTFSISYGDGSTCSGPEFTDTVTVAGVTAKSQAFSAVTTLSSEFQQGTDPADGLLGMAFQDISQLNSAPFFQNAYSQGVVPNNRFAFKLAAEGSSLYLGGTDDSAYTGDIEYNSVTGSGYWQSTGASAVVDNQEVSSGFDAIIDSGTTLIYGEADAVEQIYRQISGSQLFDSENGLYSYPCDAEIPQIGFSWGGNVWTLSSDNFNFGETEEGSNQCVGGISSASLGLGDNIWLLGDAFMRNVYTVFDFGQTAVGFATLA